MTDSNQPIDITLFRGWKSPGSYVWSPFVTKLELRLRLSHIQYKTDAGSAKSGPTGKIPYVEICEKNTPNASPISIGDSSLIANYFTEHGLIHDLDANQSASSQALDLAVRALLEDRLYFLNVHPVSLYKSEYRNANDLQMRERWIDNFYAHRDHILSALPQPVRVLVGLIIYRSICNTLHGQGTGRFTVEEATQFRRDIWTRLNGMLEESKKKAARDGGGQESTACFWALGGDEPTECDTTLFAFICSDMVAKS
jgi:hypothetical protein